MNEKIRAVSDGFNDASGVVRRQVGTCVAHVGLFGAVAMFAQTLQVKQRVGAAVLLRDDVVNVHVRLAKFPAALRAGIPAVI